MPLYRYCVLLLLAFVVSLSLNSETLLAQDERINSIGRPDRLKQGGFTGYAVYFEDGQWHINATTRSAPGKKKAVRMVFTGTVTFDKGKIKDGQFQGLEVPGKPKDLKSSDWLVLHKNKSGFDFHFTTAGRTDMLKFTPPPEATTVTFNLVSSGDDEPRRIILGANSQHPAKVPFELPAHPPEPAK